MDDPRNAEADPPGRVVVVGPDEIATDGGTAESGGERPVIEMVEQPAKVMRIGSMIRQLLDEVRAAPLDEKSRARLKEIHQSSIKELEDGLATELVDELERLSLPFAEDEVPSEAELRVAQAQLEQMRRALPAGMMPGAAEDGPPPQQRSSGPYL